MHQNCLQTNLLYVSVKASMYVATTDLNNENFSTLLQLVPNFIDFDIWSL